MLAADRRASRSGDVETGEIVGQFSRMLPERQCSIDGFTIVADKDAGAGDSSSAPRPTDQVDREGSL
jgi:hypothetical protein